MTRSIAWQARTIVALWLLMLFPVAAGAQPKTDVVVLANGDRITGEIVKLDRGRLEFKTDDAGTLYLEWDKLTSLVTSQIVEIVTADGRTFVGSLGNTTARSLAIITAEGTMTLTMTEATEMTPIGRSFWRKVDGSFDAGFNYTKSSGIAQLNVNSNTVYRKPGFQARLAASLTQTQQSDEDEDGNDDRSALEASYLRYPWPRWFIAGAGRFESNQSLGIDLRSQIGGVVGPRLVNSNRAQLTVGAGVAFNDEQGTDGTATQNLDALFAFQTSFYTYDRPRINLDIAFQYYPSLSNFGRQRLQLDTSARREVWKDFFLSLSLFDTFDSQPPGENTERNDFGIVFSIGWSY